MKITPLEIKQKTFEKKIRGYDKDEVAAFLLSLSHEWEQLQESLKELQMKYDHSQDEVKKLREVESSLFKTLKTAEDTGANMIDQANKTAELHLRETQMNADALLNEAKSTARNTIEQAEAKAQKIIAAMDEEMKKMSQTYKELVNIRDNMATELRHISSDTMGRVEKMMERLPANNVEELLAKGKKVSQTEKNQAIIKPKSSEKDRPPKEEPDKSEKQDKAEEQQEELYSGEGESPEDTSFFDEIGR